ncbi:hypothetical protein A4A49_04790 [Nicotiana attenuata]|uniref:Uncharacterized protein n=1 Tax=Nicotiana attenuata TaxID=49451 RepID=A0A314LCM5_NICAT|nr:hypothetical protein A4A49_04790 [Nicotiana attenuata]
MELKIVVPEHMVDNFTRIHEVEVSKSKLCKQELEALHLRKRVLQRIAIARANGITQCEITKEFGIKANNFFHIFKELEVLGLIVRHEAIIWTNEASNKGKLINYLPILRDICNKLEKAKGKVLAISNIKQDLGYRDALGHKEWRKNILRRLTQA